MYLIIMVKISVSEEERFEEALNDEAPDLLDECFWIIRGFQTGIYDAMIFDEDIYRNGYVKYLMENIECEEKEDYLYRGSF